MGIYLKAKIGFEIDWKNNTIVATDKSLLSIGRWKEGKPIVNPDYLPVEREIVKKVITLLKARDIETTYSDLISSISWEFAWHVKGEPEFISDFLYQINRNIQETQLR